MYCWFFNHNFSGDIQKDLLTKELEAMGIRLNTKKPDVYFKLKKTGGVKLTSMVPLTNVSEKLAQLILHEYKIHNCELVIREDITADQLIDVICGNRVYLPCIYVYNKVDQITIEEVGIDNTNSNINIRVDPTS